MNGCGRGRNQPQAASAARSSHRDGDGHEASASGLPGRRQEPP